MTDKISNVVDDLRGQLAAIEGRQVELVAERDEISYAAIVDRKPEAVKRLAALNGELANIATQTASLTAALREAAKRESQARDQELAAKRREDARKAGVEMAEAEKLAVKFDEALQVVGETSVAFEAAMIRIRQLTGSSPAYDSVRVFMFRAVRSALHRTPVHIDAISPAEQTTLSEASASWSRSIRNWIAGVLENKTQAAKAAEEESHGYETAKTRHQ